MKPSIHPALLAFSISMALLINGCAPASTPSSVEPLQTKPSPQPANTLEADAPIPTDVPHTIAEIEELAGFDVREPAYFPTGVSFDFASYQKTPSPNVVLHFKLVHETYGDMGAFFQIMQEPQIEAPPDTISCGEIPEGCEVLQIGAIPVVYHLNPAGTEGLDWYTAGFLFRLLRTAGEPNKIYKDELIKVVGSMK
jgi:hypothetical protein